MAKYLLDSNFWINAKNYYPFDLFPSFWEKLKSLIESGDVAIHQTVWEEINRKEDGVTSWLANEPKFEVMQISDEAFQRYLEICQWAEDKAQGYTRQAVDEFEQNDRADAWICAEASVSGLTLVTNEKRSNSPNKVKIPNACEAFGVEYVSNLDFMRSCGFLF